MAVSPESITTPLISFTSPKNRAANEIGAGIVELVSESACSMLSCCIKTTWSATQSLGWGG